ncbi:MAG: hypothetical protein LQ344_001674 [Seirophora lacunosa]|nr:MAG: hypothetical protein LQ344_001674 [Seirophora lacunosa]
MDVTEAIQGLGEPRLLETIDKLVELHIGDTVALPQLLVVGDQSSGKSSVLEGLTGLPFPRASTLCTRFATQIIFRRTSIQTIDISIIPSRHSSKEDAERLTAWKKPGLTSLDRKTFAQIFEEVNEIMNLRGSSPSAQRSFSNDVLKIEVAGPDQQHLSVIDVPGIFRKVTPGITSPEDIPNIKNMVQQYMENPRSVILAVISANVDIANQEILDMAERCDPDGQRTLGVLTKPDLIDRGAEGSVLDLLLGTAHKLNLGWSMVKNPGQEDLNREDEIDRHSVERAFFRTKAPWCTVDKDRVGTDSLRLRLVELLTEIVRKEFNNVARKHFVVGIRHLAHCTSQVRTDVNQALKTSEKKLEALGPSRETKEQQRRYLQTLATRFQAMTAWAIEAQYGSDDAFDLNYGLRLATEVVNRNRSFSDDVWHKGHTMKFKQTPIAPVCEVSYETIREGPVPVVIPDIPKPAMDPANTRETSNPPNLDDLLFNERIHATPQDGIIEWLHDVYNESRGFEIGTFNASLVPIMWKKQSSKWKDLALGYTSDIISISHNYIHDLLEEICEDDRIRKNLLAIMMDKLIERYQQAIDQTKLILQVERSPLTVNHYFADNMAK